MSHSCTDSPKPELAAAFVKLPVPIASSAMDSSAKVVYAVLADQLRRGVVPSVTKLMDGAGCTAPTVRLAIRQLVAAGLVAVSDNGNGRGKTYRILCDTPKESFTRKGSFPVKGSFRVTGKGSFNKPGKDLSPHYTETENNTENNSCATAPSAGRQETLLPEDSPGLKPSPKTGPKPRPQNADAIYQAYPRKVGKVAAVAAIVKAIERIAKTRDDAADWLLARVRQYAESPAGQQGRFTPHPATWFNQARYDDEPSEWSQGGGSNGTFRPARTAPDDPGYRHIGKDYSHVAG